MAAASAMDNPDDDDTICDGTPVDDRRRQPLLPRLLKVPAGGAGGAPLRPWGDLPLAIMRDDGGRSEPTLKVDTLLLRRCDDGGAGVMLPTAAASSSADSLVLLLLLLLLALSKKRPERGSMFASDESEAGNASVWVVELLLHVV